MGDGNMGRVTTRSAEAKNVDVIGIMVYDVMEYGDGIGLIEYGDGIGVIDGIGSMEYGDGIGIMEYATMEFYAMEFYAIMEYDAITSREPIMGDALNMAETTIRGEYHSPQTMVGDFVRSLYATLQQKR